jgi:hypothetical protein
VERVPAPFLGGPLPLRFSRSALLCQYLPQQLARGGKEARGKMGRGRCALSGGVAVKYILLQRCHVPTAEVMPSAEARHAQPLPRVDLHADAGSV